MDPPLGSGEVAGADELDRLRRRAYGPDADIAGDAAAQARLSELEAARSRHADSVAGSAGQEPAMGRASAGVSEPVEAARTAPSSAPARDGEAFDEHEPDPRSVTGQAPAPESVAAPGRIGIASAASWWARRRWLVVTGGAITALAIVAIHGAWMSQPRAEGPTPIARDVWTVKLPPVPDALGRGGQVFAADDVLTLESAGEGSLQPNDKHGTLDALGVSIDDLRRYEDFDGLNIWSGQSRYGMTCLFVAVPVQGLREGLGAEGCSPAGIDTAAELVRRNGDLVQFVLRDDHVDVYVYVRAADPSTARG